MALFYAKASGNDDVDEAGGAGDHLAHFTLLQPLLDPVGGHRRGDGVIL